jgi:prepilin-type N-terminal cleavage/methylation domain-containing protein
LIRRRDRGFTLIEIVFTLAILGILILILARLEGDTSRFERQLRVDMFTHPEKSAVVSRFRSDVLDSKRDDFPSKFDEFEQKEDVLILKMHVAPKDPAKVVVWDFREAKKAKRLEYAGSTRQSEWIANEVPKFKVSTYTLPGTTAPYFVRLQAFDSKENLVVDQIALPRAY